MDLTKIATLGVAIDPKAAKAGAKSVNGSLDSVAWTARNVVKSVNKELRGMGRGFREVKSSANLLSRSLKAAFSAYIIRDVINTAVSFETLRNTLTAAIGSVEGGRREMDYAIKTTRDLGLNLDATTRSYAILTAASKGTALAGQDTRDAFTAVAKASAVLGLTADQTHGVIFALSQMISKGKIASEELRRQLGDRLPGAFQIAARAMKMTTKELDKAISTGKVFPEEFIPAFIAGMEDAFGPHTWRVVDSARAKLNRFSTDMKLLKLEFAESGFMDAFLGVLDGLSKALRDPEVILSAKNLSGSLQFIVQDTDTLKTAMHGLTFFLESVAMGFLAIASGARIASAAWKTFEYKDREDYLKHELERLESKSRFLDNERKKGFRRDNDVAVFGMPQYTEEEWTAEKRRVLEQIRDKALELGSAVDARPENFTQVLEKEMNKLMEFRLGIWREDPPVDLAPTKIKPPLVEDNGALSNLDSSGGSADESDKAKKAIDKVTEALKFEQAQLKRTATEQRIYNELKKAGTTLNEPAGKTIQSLVTAIEKDRAAQKKRLELQAEGKQLTADLRTETEKYADELERLNVLLEAEAISQETYNRALAAARPEAEPDYWTNYLDSMEARLLDFDELAGNTLENLTARFGEFFESAIFDSENLGDAFSTMVEGMSRSLVSAIGEMIAQWLVYQVVSAVAGKSAASGGASALATNAEAASLQAGINAYSSTAAIPIVGPAMAPAAMATALAATEPMAATVAALAAAGIVGQAHDGIDAVPATGTWLLEKGERVTTAGTSDRLDRTLARIEAGQGNAAPAQQPHAAPQQPQNIRVVNVMDPSVMDSWANSSSGEKTIMNHITRNAGQIRQVLGG